MCSRRERETLDNYLQQALCIHSLEKRQEISKDVIYVKLIVFLIAFTFLLKLSCAYSLLIADVKVEASILSL